MKHLFIALLFGSLALFAKPVLAVENQVICKCTRDSDGRVSEYPLTAGACQNVIDQVIGSKCVITYPGYCWCKTGPTGVCENHTNDAAGNLIKTQSDCDSYCSSRGKTWSSIHYDSTYINWNNKYTYEQGCKPTYCWCKNPNGTCENHAELPIKDDTACQQYCTGRGAGWSKIAFDTSYINHSLEDQCNQKACWCQNSVSLECKNLGTSGYGIQETCSLDCSKVDNTREWKMLAWDGATVDYTKIPAAQGGCLQDNSLIRGWCWCKTASDLCEKVTVDATGKAIVDEQSCNIACAVKGKMLRFDTTGRDLTKDDICKAAIQASDQAAKDAAEIEAKAKESLNQLKLGAKRSLSRMNFNSAAEIIGQLIKVLTVFMGMIAFALYLYAGALWMGAMGNSEQIEKAKNIIVWTTMGVGAVLASSILAQFLFHDVLKVI